MAASHKWTFKARFRSRAFGWRGSRLASQRLKEAVSEIKKAARADSVLGAEGAVALMERIWPALQGVDGSSGALGAAVGRALEALIPLLISAHADRPIRAKWLDQLFAAVDEDGVSFLDPVEEQWGHICVWPDLANEWADRVLPALQHVWKADERGAWVVGTTLCLSCLLKTERYDELHQVLAMRPYRFWPDDRFGAEALVRQGRTDEAIAYAQAQLSHGSEDVDIMRFCERVLLDVGRGEEAYRRFGLTSARGNTRLATYRSIVKAYPGRDAREILLDLIETRGDKGKWFASAKHAGSLDIALECAIAGATEPATLIRAARDFAETQPMFAARVALCAMRGLLSGSGYEPTALDMSSACRHLMAAARKLDAVGWATAEMQALLQSDASCEPVMQQAMTDWLRRSTV